MYSLVLMAAMTTPADAEGWGPLFHRCGCHGFVGFKGFGGGSCAGCGGFACAGCVGARPVGCVGSVHVGCAGSLVAPAPMAAPAPMVATGVWPGLTCGGCCGGHFFGKGGCWGTGGYRQYFSCHGAGSAWGHAYAGISYGFAGCYGSCYGSYTNYFSYWAQPINVHYGYGMPMYVNPQIAPPGGPVPPPPPPVKPVPPAPKKAGIDAAAVIITLPADAKLYANGIRMQQTGEVREFVTPELPSDEPYRYVFTAEIIRDDKPMTETYEVDVQAGMETRVSFARLIAATPASTRVASK